MKVQNLYANIPVPLPEEVFDTLLQGRAVRVERIVPHGQASPPDFWYDQPDHEWVVLLAGNAGLRFAGESDTVVLGRATISPSPPEPAIGSNGPARSSPR